MAWYVLLLCSALVCCSAFVAFVFLATLPLRIFFHDVRTTQYIQMVLWEIPKGKYRRSNYQTHTHQTYGLICVRI